MVFALVAAMFGSRPAAATTQPQPTCRGYLACFLLGVRAYIYSYPMVMTGVTSQVATNVPDSTTTTGRAPINQFSINPLPDDTYTDIVLPNVNTPYSPAWLDLTNEPMILHIPDLGDRFFIMESMDAWTDVIPDSPGARTNASGPGDYAYVGPGWKGQLPSGLAGVFHFRTNTVLIGGRTYSTGSQKDLADVAAIQAQYTLTPLSKYGHPYTPPSNVPFDPNLDMSTPYLQIEKMDASTFFKAAAKQMGPNPPLATDKIVVGEMAKIGLVPGRPFAFDTFDPVTRRALEDAVRAGNGIVNFAADRTAPTTTLWNMELGLGSYGRQYLLRAAIARAGYGANYFADAVYAGTFVAGNNVQLNGQHQYTLRFEKGQLPPSNPKAFWSVTLYKTPGGTLYASPNNRNALGIPAVQDHLPMSDPNDGSLTFYIQTEQPDPVTQPLQYANWLPAPPGDFVLLLRMYWPDQSLFDGDWIPPAVQQMDP
jgi:hypothetical protein